MRELPVWNAAQDNLYKGDWLIHAAGTKAVIYPATKAAVYRSADDSVIILFNGLVKRSFALRPDVACFDYRNMSNGQQLLRSLKP
jgi:hypothetical protein